MGAPGTTQGPWSVAHSTISWWIEAPTDMSRQIAGGALPADTWHMTKEERQGCRAMRDAHQTAASGALYDAADYASLILVRLKQDYLPSSVGEEWIVTAIKLLDAALAQARGEVSVHTLEGGL